MGRMMRNEILTDKILMTLTTNAAKAVEKARLSRDAKNAASRNQELATFIRQRTDAATTIEDLLHLEMTLQKHDFLTAQTAADRQSIKNAQADYRQLVVGINQMRTDPKAYLVANQSSKETGGDFRKLPKSRGPQQISGNKARLQNRASFVSADQRIVWDARLHLASCTEIMLRALHKNLIAEYGQFLKVREQSTDH